MWFDIPNSESQLAHAWATNPDALDGEPDPFPRTRILLAAMPSPLRRWVASPLRARGYTVVEILNNPQQELPAGLFGNVETGRLADVDLVVACGDSNAGGLFLLRTFRRRDWATPFLLLFEDAELGYEDRQALGRRLGATEVLCAPLRLPTIVATVESLAPRHWSRPHTRRKRPFQSARRALSPHAGHEATTLTAMHSPPMLPSAALGSRLPRETRAGRKKRWLKLAPIRPRLAAT